MKKSIEQVTNVAKLPGIVKASYAMPDAHWGYGFPIGGVAAFDADKGGVISAGGVGFDISCGVRTLLTGLTLEEIQAGKRTTGGCTVSQHSRRRRQHGKAESQSQRNGRHAHGRGEMGGRHGLRHEGKIFNGSKKTAASRAHYRMKSPTERKNASATRWALSVPAIIIWKSSMWRRFSTTPSLPRSNCAKAISL